MGRRSQHRDSYSSHVSSDNGGEMFGGVGPSAVPTAVSTFHHMRSPQSFQSGQDDDEASFRFFSLQDIESARGVSSLATVDYDTDWQDSEFEDDNENDGIHQANNGNLPRSYDSTTKSSSAI